MVAKQATRSGGLRERNKSRRRQQILDATRRLLRRRPADEVSVEEIAELAEVAPATVYNLLGPRDAIWAALISDVIDELSKELDRLPDNDPIARAHAVITISVRLFAADSKVHQQALLHRHALPGGRSAPRHNPVVLQIDAMRDAIDAGTLVKELTPEQLGHQIFASYNGALYFWTMGGLSAAEFERLALHGLYSVLAAAATDEARPRFLSELRRLGRGLTSHMIAARA